MPENNTNDELEELSEQLQHWLTDTFSNGEVFKEYELIAAVGKQGFFERFEPESLNLALFKKHFLLMNALYHLRRSLVAHSKWLVISALEIKVTGFSSESDSTELAGTDTYLDDYYLDWQHFHEATEDSVNDLLASFWKAYSAQDKSTEALAFMGFDAMPSEPALREKYRSMANEYHPDKGGEASEFIRLREYYLCLRKLVN